VPSLPPLVARFGAFVRLSSTARTLREILVASRGGWPRPIGPFDLREDTNERAAPDPEVEQGPRDERNFTGPVASRLERGIHPDAPDTRATASGHAAR